MDGGVVTMGCQIRWRFDGETAERCGITRQASWPPVSMGTVLNREGPDPSSFSFSLFIQFLYDADLWYHRIKHAWTSDLCVWILNDVWIGIHQRAKRKRLLKGVGSCLWTGERFLWHFCCHGG
jgi:hypothetical protein